MTSPPAKRCNQGARRSCRCRTLHPPRVHGTAGHAARHAGRPHSDAPCSAWAPATTRAAQLASGSRSSGLEPPPSRNRDSRPCVSERRGGNRGHGRCPAGPRPARTARGVAPAPGRGSPFPPRSLTLGRVISSSTGGASAGRPAAACASCTARRKPPTASTRPLAAASSPDQTRPCATSCAENKGGRRGGCRPRVLGQKSVARECAGHSPLPLLLPPSQTCIASTVMPRLAAALSLNTL